MFEQKKIQFEGVFSLKFRVKKIEILEFKRQKWKASFVKENT